MLILALLLKILNLKETIKSQKHTISINFEGHQTPNTISLFRTPVLSLIFSYNHLAVLHHLQKG